MDTPDLPTPDDFLSWGRAAVARWPLRPDQVALVAPTPGEFVLIWTMQDAPDPRPASAAGARPRHPFEMEPGEAERHAEADRRRRDDARRADNLARMLDPLLSESLGRGLVIAAGDGALAMVRSAAERAPAWWCRYPAEEAALSYTATLLDRVRLIAEGARVSLYSAFELLEGEAIDPLSLWQVRGSWSAAEVRARARAASAS